MKFEIDAKALADAMATVGRIIAKTSTQPVLTHALITAQGDELSIRGSDIDTQVDLHLPAQVKIAGSLAIPSTILHGLAAKSQPGARLSVEYDAAGDDPRATIKSGRSRLLAAVLPEQDFPLFSHNVGDEITISARSLCQALAKTAHAISKEETRFYLRGVFMRASGEDLLFVSTDGHKLSKLTQTVSGSVKGAWVAGFIVPEKTIHLLLKIFDKTDGDVRMIANASSVKFECDGASVTSKLIDASYPDFQRVIPNYSGAIEIEIKSKILLESLKKFDVLGEARTGTSVKITARPGELLLEKKDMNNGAEMSDVLDARVDGSKIEFAVSGLYLQDVVDAAGSETIILKLNDDKAPIGVFYKNDHEHTQVVMPMRF